MIDTQCGDSVFWWDEKCLGVCDGIAKDVREGSVLVETLNEFDQFIYVWLDVMEDGLQSNKLDALQCGRDFIASEIEALQNLDAEIVAEWDMLNDD
jgi:hypothetical protein